IGPRIVGRVGTCTECSPALPGNSWSNEERRMAFGIPNLDAPIDAGLRPLSAVRQRSLRRHVWMLILFVALCTIIWAYWTITDSNRVRDMAESALSKLVGGKVRVGSATLSISEG